MKLNIYIVEMETEEEIDTAYVAAPDKSIIQAYGRGILKKMNPDIPYGATYKIKITPVNASTVKNLSQIIIVNKEY
jgi:hypothetical protein